MSSQLPLCLALHLGDGVYVDPLTGKVTILGSFDVVPASPEGVILPLLMVYAELCGGRGRCELVAELLQLQIAAPERRVLARAALAAEFDAPERPIRVSFRFKSLVLPVVGGYVVELRADGSSVAQRALLVERGSGFQD